MVAKSLEIAELLNFYGPGRAKIILLLEEYLADDGDTSDNSNESDGQRNCFIR